MRYIKFIEVDDPELKNKIEKIFKTQDQNEIGRIGEVIAEKYILSRFYPYPNYSIRRTNIDDDYICRMRTNIYELFYIPDFVVESKDGSERILVEVKTTIRKKIKIRGGAKEEFRNQLKKAVSKGAFTKLLIIKIRLGGYSFNCPYVKYSIDEIKL
ncbi:MAG: hypothetical protein QXM09_05780 [Candidatus Methanomethylicaceae archaeon]